MLVFTVFTKCWITYYITFVIFTCIMKKRNRIEIPAPLKKTTVLLFHMDLRTHLHIHIFITGRSVCPQPSIQEPWPRSVVCPPVHFHHTPTLSMWLHCHFHFLHWWLMQALPSLFKISVQITRKFLIKRTTENNSNQIMFDVKGTDFVYVREWFYESKLGVPWFSAITVHMSPPRMYA